MRKQVAVGLILRLAERQIAIPQVGRPRQEAQRVRGEVEFRVGRCLPRDCANVSASATDPTSSSQRRESADPAAGLATVAVLDPVQHRRGWIASGQLRLGVLLHHQSDPKIAAAPSNRPTTTLARRAQ